MTLERLGVGSRPRVSFEDSVVFAENRILIVDGNERSEIECYVVEAKSNKTLRKELLPLLL